MLYVLYIYILYMLYIYIYAIYMLDIWYTYAIYAIYAIYGMTESALKARVKLRGDVCEALRGRGPGKPAPGPVDDGKRAESASEVV